MPGFFRTFDMLLYTLLTNYIQIFVEVGIFSRSNSNFPGLKLYILLKIGHKLEKQIYQQYVYVISYKMQQTSGL